MIVDDVIDDRCFQMSRERGLEGRNGSVQFNESWGTSRIDRVWRLYVLAKGAGDSGISCEMP
jgi:hypothetical protein